MTTAPGDESDAGGPDTESAAPDAADRDPAAVVDDVDRPVLLFDGVCNLCNALVRFVVRFDAEGRFLFAPLQSDVGREFLRRHGRPTEDFDTMVLVEDGECYEKSTAALRTFRYLDGPWPLLYPMSYLPVGLRDRVYDLVAENRYRIFGKKEECPVPEPEIRERFANRTLE
ncbi:thiol-disulfide oxidoreductase DCC family protein [Halomicrobium salinisoli]|uniref:thiol-disulfide oxidoreductase DCC family protein n=1 Tax=Halomicrobium salinisoli TaxID=2878391 RepID=UPI001CF00292|nr:thiol-disulfide oxidoreductase DCC family protein [Halomicrobium salinisoli]